MSEIPPQNLRGFVGTVNGLAMCVGNLVTNIIGLPEILGSDKLWPYLLGFIILPALVHIFGLPFCIESPKYLFLTKNKPSEARLGRLSFSLGNIFKLFNLLFNLKYWKN